MKSLLYLAFGLSMMGHPHKAEVKPLENQVRTIYQKSREICEPYEQKGIYCPVNKPPVMEGEILDTGNTYRCVAARAWSEKNKSMIFLGPERVDQTPYIVFIDRKPFGSLDRVYMHDDIAYGDSQVKTIDITHSNQAQETYLKLVENLAVSINGGKPNTKFLKEDYTNLVDMYSPLLKE